MSSMRLDIRQISDNPGSRFEYKISEKKNLVTQDEPFLLKIDLSSGHLRLENVEKGILVKSNIEAEITQECDRCINVFKRLEDLEFEDLFYFPENDNKDIEDDYLIEKDDHIDIGEYLQQQIRLRFPIKILCKPDCQGLCPRCGVDLNNEKCDCHEEKIDPRMAKLKTLLDE